MQKAHHPHIIAAGLLWFAVWDSRILLRMEKNSNNMHRNPEAQPNGLGNCASEQGSVCFIHSFIYSHIVH